MIKENTFILLNYLQQKIIKIAKNLRKFTKKQTITKFLKIKPKMS